MDKKNLRKMLVYLATALIVPTVFQVIFQKSIDEAKSIYSGLLYSALLFLACLVIIFLIELIKFLLRLKHTKSSIEMLKSIDRIANSIKMPDGSPMFDIEEDNFALCDTITAQESKVRHAFRDSHHIIYHSTTAKKDLNWIEYVFWSLLRRLHNELGCDIVISLHYDEKARESGLSDHKEQNRYDELFRSYSSIAKSLIGNDITIIDEKDFRCHKRHAKYFASVFHDKYVKCTLQYVQQLAANEINYKGFMRKLSYIESVFPVMAYSRSRWKTTRLYVLDRELAQEVWRQSPFIEFKNTYGIYFITGQTIRDKDGYPIRIFSSNDTINITDSAHTITNKLAMMDNNTKETMFSLLKSSFDNNYEAEENLSDDLLRDLIIDIKTKYHFDEI